MSEYDDFKKAVGILANIIVVLVSIFVITLVFYAKIYGG